MYGVDRPVNVRHRPLLLALGCALPAALEAVLQLGRLHPDEVFQFLEPANVQAFGYGTLAWEWDAGLRLIGPSCSGSGCARRRERPECCR